MTQWQPEYPPRQRHLPPPSTAPQWQQQHPQSQQYQPQQPQGCGPRPPQQPPRRRRPRKGLRILAWGSAGLLALIVLAIALGSKNDGSRTAAQSSPAATASAHAAKAPADTAAKAVSACFARRAASGDIYVRTVIPGLAAQAQELGGGYAWDHVTGKCLNSVDYTTASAANGPGDCTTVGYVADNPGYNADATPAAPLKNVDGVAGPGC